ncbi:endo alpha-1,4 polygalactosaminidase [Bradyrhizobium septentrionale]|uniref:Endo alpha-1,4 polygalactosaminidase n=1 Tax=Bradyrhizobium septentrionale TaxID=1404411 RepID=A0A974A3A9_9BRAD|nr:endo alpha-1,4 polygalactosaminidase [Bradyrhizobium septentrionale]UGY16907.1 endo alpha-1,4 polygalactosaminidase [Bradyrhizobium septentrionale]
MKFCKRVRPRNRSLAKGEIASLLRRGREVWRLPMAREERAHLISRRQLGILLGIISCAPSLLGAAQLSEKRKKGQIPFLVYYGASTDPAIGAFALAALDSDLNLAPLDRFRRDATYLGYLSLSEVHSGRPYFVELAAEGLLFGANANWPDARFIDLRHENWRRRVVKDLVPGILQKGFDGVFLDTLDSAEFLERQDPSRYGGMVEGAADLVRAIRTAFPGILIMINRGFAVLPLIAGHFDMVLGESVRTTFDAGTGRYSFVSESDYEWQRQQLWAAGGRDPNLQLFSLDYWDPNDKENIAKIYTEERANGFVPYVATPDLTRIVPPP